MPVTVEDQGGKIVIDNGILNFTFSIRHGRFLLRRSGGASLPALLNVTAQAKYRSGSRNTTARMDAPGSIVWKGAPGRDVHGTGHHSLFYWTGEDAGLGLTVVMYDELPFMLLRLTLNHRDQNPWTVESLSPMIADEASNTGLRFATAPGDLSILRNGWTSWSPALCVRPGEPPLDTQFVKHARTAYLNAQTPPGNKNELWSEGFTVVGPLAGSTGTNGSRTGLVAGFISQADQFPVIGVTLPPPVKGAEPQPCGWHMQCQCDDLSLPPDTTLASEWAYLQWAGLEQSDVLAEYALAVARQMEVRIPLRGPVGWSSWRQPGDTPSEQNVTTALARLARQRERLPVELVQVESGYADIPGDWMQVNSNRFPRGMAGLADQIRGRGFTPGIWIAPFVVHPDSLIAADHPEWLLKDNSGRPVSAGLYDGANLLALDLTAPDAGEWLAELMHRIRREWGFPCMTLDLLYAAALPGKRHDPSMTRAQALRRGLQIIRESVGPDTFLIASGCPLGPAIGVVNAMRVGPDLPPSWYARSGRWATLFKPGPAMPGARNAIRNTMTRSATHRRWWLNLSDTLVLGENLGEAGGLTLAEARSLASTVGLSGGLLMWGDAPGQLTPERLALLPPLLPEISEFATPQDLLEHELPERYVLRLDRPHGAWSVLAVYNWEDTPRDLVIDLADAQITASGDFAGSRPLHLYDFWARQYHRLTGDAFLLPQVPAHGVTVLGIRPLAPGPHLVASSFHISQGGEIADWKMQGGQLSFTVALGRHAEGEVLLWSAGPPQSATCDGRAVEIVDYGGGVSALRFAVAQTARIAVTLG